MVPLVFAPGNKYAFFSSGAFRLEIAEEEFIQGSSCFSELNFGTSYA